MSKKALYQSPRAEIIDLSYAEPVCQAISTMALLLGGTLPTYTVDSYTPEWED